MPRHRVERKSRHRAQRPTRERAPRAQLRAAPGRPPPSHAKPPEGPSASDRLAAFGVRYRPYQRQLLTGAARGLLVSPWFAAGAGFVIAAGAFIYAPHAELSFLPAIRQSPCHVAGCTVPLAGAPPIEAGQGDGQVTPPPTPASTPATPARNARHGQSDGPTFTYVVQTYDSGMFHLILTVASSQAIGDWQLSIVIPDATAISVPYATGQLSQADVSALSGTTGDSRGSDAGNNGESSPGSAGSLLTARGTDSQNNLYLVIEGQGAPTGPTQFSFDGVSRHFSQG